MFVIRELLFLLLFFVINSNSLMCKNEKNESVDWYVLYKLPIVKNKNPLIEGGAAYMFMTSNDYQNGWILSNYSINDTQSIPALTLQPIYENKSEMYIFYNDEKPSGKKNDKLGHTKGVITSNMTFGFWLVHSVPRYPPENYYTYPINGLNFGQSFLCISFDLNTINKVGKQLLYNEPNIYKAYINSSLEAKLVNIKAVIQKQKVVNQPWNRLITLVSVGGENFTSFAKNAKFGKEIYVDWVAPTFKSDLKVESWLNGEGKIPSNCNNTYKVNNIETINLIDVLSFKSTRDHSKWAVTSINATEKLVCIGDINREEHQKKRGGGTVCIAKQELWNAYNQSINEIESCK